MVRKNNHTREGLLLDAMKAREESNLLRRAAITTDPMIEEFLLERGVELLRLKSWKLKRPNWKLSR
jgi:hypothetical protein